MAEAGKRTSGRFRGVMTMLLVAVLAGTGIAGAGVAGAAETRPFGDARILAPVPTPPGSPRALACSANW